MKFIGTNIDFSEKLKTIIHTGKLPNASGILSKEDQMKASIDLFKEESDTIDEMIRITKGE